MREISTPTARGGQTLVRLKMRNLLTSAVSDKTFKAGDKFKEPDLQLVPGELLVQRRGKLLFPWIKKASDTLTLSMKSSAMRWTFWWRALLLQVE